MVTRTFVSQLRELFPPDRIFTDPVDCYAYAYDNSRKVFPPEVVVFPVDAEEVKAIVGICNEHGVPLTPRGRGTGTSGGSLPEQGGVALSLERMSRIVAVDAANRVAVA